MKGRFRITPTTWLTAAVLVLLPLLAVMQYRWLSQIGADAGTRMRAVAANAAAALSRDLQFEVGRACRERSGGGGAIASDAAGSRPPLVVDALVVDRGKPAIGELRLRRWDFDAGTCELFDWPAGYDVVRAQTRECLARPSDKEIARIVRSLAQAGASLGVVPLVPRGGDRQRMAIRPPCEGFADGVVLFRLDMALLRRTVLPELIRRHLDALQRDDFHFAILGARGESIYASPGADPAALAAAPDISTPLAFIPDEGPARTMGSGPVPRPADSADGASRGGKQPRQGGRHEGWRLVAQHRAGSLAAAVARLRVRNLGVSFGILLLMGVAVAMIGVNARKAERLGRQQVEFVAAVSHEMRTPVSAIDLAAGNLEDGLITDPARIQRYGGVIRAEAHRMAETVERVLQFAALDAGRPIGPLVDVDLPALVGDVVARVRAEHPDASVELEIAGDLDCVRGDAAALRSCVRNLVGNALKYGGTPGWVRVRAGRHAGRKPEAHVVVEDRGPGIDARDLSRVFEPFYRGRLATERRIAGSGLGLHIVKRSMEALGGRVSVRTGQGSGTSVTLHLPLCVGPAKPAPAPGPAGSRPALPSA